MVFRSEGAFPSALTCSTSQQYAVSLAAPKLMRLEERGKRAHHVRQKWAVQTGSNSRGGRTERQMACKAQVRRSPADLLWRRPPARRSRSTALPAIGFVSTPRLALPI